MVDRSRRHFLDLSESKINQFPVYYVLYDIKVGKVKRYLEEIMTLSYTLLKHFNPLVPNFVAQGFVFSNQFRLDSGKGIFLFGKVNNLSGTFLNI